MADRAGFDWKAWTEWIALTIVGVALALIVFCVVLNNYLAKDLLGALVTIGVASTLYGAMQWIWLRRRMSKALWWIPATVLGWYMPVGLFFLLKVATGKVDLVYLDQKLGWPVRIFDFCLFSIALGLPQWLFLKRQHQSAGYWIAARPLAWLAGLGLVALGETLHIVEGFIQPDRVFGKYVGEIVGWSADGALFGFGFAAISGAALVWIQKQPKTPQTETGFMGVSV
jgi:hypothetical protein